MPVPTASPADPAVSASTDDEPVEELAARLRAGAVSLSAATAAWLLLVAEFDRRRGWALPGITSCAQWLSWQCGIGPGTARDHVRLARALPGLPEVSDQLRRGLISFAKARAIARVADADTEPVLLRVAEHCTAAQLERVVAGWRRSDRTQTEMTRARSEAAEEDARDEALADGASEDDAAAAGRRAAAAVWLEGWADGAHPDLQASPWESRFDWRDEGDGSVSLRLRLSAEDAAELVAAVEHRAEVLTRLERVARRDQDGDHERDGDTAPAEDWTAWVDGDDLDDERAAGRGLEAADRRRARVTVARTAALLDLARAGVAAVDHRAGDPARREVLIRVDAGVLADDAAAGQAALTGVAALSPAQARRLACDAAVTTVLVQGEQVLACGRSRRFATAAQRRSLLVRDGGCARPGCTETRPERLHAHHLVSWLAGGRTDVDNLVLLCDRCHGLVHDLGLTVRRTPEGRFTARTGDGAPVWVVPEPGDVTPAAPPVEGLPASWRANGERLQFRYALGVLLDNRAVLRRRRQQDHAAPEAA
ncbi:HNH endonuclease signature motif containing protein [Klenkia sp. PcliD-1-E]|uniref:HNH endonuclease signature motif containing protein n=1 Tax=Klenkia sp. PcliD-1-E TaxID=2954492 RepID=UPI002096E654|nr:HNH endonuclease signature motif containing protein [Klenkia sp. PcliD-1-E]MCO7219338.1 HNH endonuclease [Klenkia sp. PcliD-1-E]